MQPRQKHGRRIESTPLSQTSRFGLGTACSESVLKKQLLVMSDASVINCPLLPP